MFREVAQLASALRSGRRGRVFESPLPDKKGSVTEPFLSGRGDILSEAIGHVCDACYYCRVDAAFVDKPSFSRSMTPPS